MEKILPASPTTIATTSIETVNDSGVTILRPSEIDDSEVGACEVASGVDTLAASAFPEATAPIVHGEEQQAIDPTASFALGTHAFADEIELATKEPARIDADSELMSSLSGVPQKMAFKIGEVAEMLGVKQYVLRYWETEFEALRPKKSKNNQRVYTRREVETAMLIKKLLYKDRFSIEGARAALKQLRGQVKEERNWKAVAQGQSKIAGQLQGLITDIRRLHDSLA